MYVLNVSREMESDSQISAVVQPMMQGGGHFHFRAE